MRTHVTLRLICDSERMWDTVEVQAWDQDEVVNWYRREVFVGQSHEVALHKAETELETLLVKLGWFEPGGSGLRPDESALLVGDQSIGSKARDFVRRARG